MLALAARAPHVIALEGAHISGAADYQDLLAAASPAEPARPDLDDESPYCILYTSGTTGRPKGAVLPHRQILWNCINTVISWGLNESDIAPVLTPMFHAGGLFIFLLPLHYAGGRVLLARTFDAEASLRAIEEEGCTVVLGVPTLFQVWKDCPSFAAADFSRVRFFINGGASIPVPLLQHWRDAKQVVMRQGYGLTEAGVNCFSMTDEESVRKAGSVGKPIFHSQMRLIDPETGQDVALGETGELLIAGPHICAGYWRNPVATAETIRDGWLHTGDMARRDEDGYFYITGRYKDMIKSGGENIYAAEVEAVFRDHPAVAECALIGLPDPRWGEVGLMAVVLKPGMQTQADELQSFCQGRLARYKIPRRVEFVAGLPYSPYGKVLKSELKAMFVSDNR
jgi:fatty-acyl-CoA synthase